MRGNALVLVIVAIAALVAIAMPFALEMRLSERTSRAFAASIRAEHAARAARDLSVLRLFDLHPAAQRRAGEADHTLADAPEDWTSADQLAVTLSALPGDTPFEVHDPRGTMLAAEIEDEQGKANLNSASGLLLGNLLGVAELATDIDESATEIPIAGDIPFFSDGDPRTYDGVLLIGSELVVYRDIERPRRAGEPGRIRGCERGAFFSTPMRELMRHRKGDLVHDARGWKLAEHKFWAEMGGYRPFLTLAGAREIAGWQLVDLELARWFRQGVTPEILAAYGLGGEALRSVGAGRLVDRVERRARFSESAPPSATAVDDGEAGPPGVARVLEGAEAGKANGKDVVDDALRRLGRRAGRKWLDQTLRAVQSRAQQQARPFVEAAKTRIRQLEDEERAYYPSAAEQAARLADARDIEVLTVRELEGLRGSLTVASERPGEWAGDALVLNRVRYDPKEHETKLVLGVDIPEARYGAAARIVGPNGKVQYREVDACSRGGIGSAPEITVFPEIEGDHPGGTLRVSVAPAHPVNINTASRRVLEALLVGLECSFVGEGENVKRDFVTKKGAAAVARRIIDSAPVKGLAELGAILQAAVDHHEISGPSRLAILLDATDPGSPMLRTHTAPFAFRGGEVATVNATGIVNDPAGNEIARHTVREVVAVTPPRETTLHMDSQADLFAGYPDESLRPGRRTNLIETTPDGLVGAGLAALVSPVAAIPYPDRSHEPGQGELRLAQGEAPGFDWGGGDSVLHFRREPEGHKMGSGLVETSDPVVRGVASLNGIVPGLFEMWFRMSNPKAYTVFFDTGPEDDDHNRLACFYDGTEVVLEASDTALDQAEPRYFGKGPRRAELRAPATFQKDRWYHVAATWRGTRAGDLALFVDGLPVKASREAHVTRLARDLDDASLEIALEDGSEFPVRGAALVGTEPIDYDNAGGQWRDTGAAGNILHARRAESVDPQTGQRVVTRDSRGTSRAHRKGTPVQVFGYTELLTPIANGMAPRSRIPAGPCFNTGPLPKLTPKALLYPETLMPGGCFGIAAGATTIPVLSDDTFPATDGVIQIEHERIHYAAAVPASHPDQFTGCTRGYDGTEAANHLALAAVMLCDVKVSPNNGAFDDETLVQLSIPSDPPAGVDPQPEWLHVLKPQQPKLADRFYLRHVPPGLPTRPPSALSGVEIRPPLKLPTKQVYRATPYFAAWKTFEMGYARGCMGTAPRDHGATERLIGTFTSKIANHGTLDWVTVTEPDPAIRVERRIAWAAGPYAALSDFVPREYSSDRVARLVKRPSGELPTSVARAFSIGGRRPGATSPGPPGILAGRVDEVRLASDAESWARAGAGLGNLSAYAARCGLGLELPWLKEAMTGAAPGGKATLAWDAGRYALNAATYGDHLNLLLARDAGTHGYLLKLDDEIVGVGRAQGADTIVTARGLLGTQPAPHSDEVHPYFLPFPPHVRFAGGLGGAKGELIPMTGEWPGAGVPVTPGYLALDAQDGGGLVEMLPFDRFEAKAFRRPVDDHGRGAYRGAFGTARDTPILEQALGFIFPFRFHDRYQPELESDCAVFWQATFAPPGAAAGSACLFRSIAWDQELPYGDVSAVVIARVDGKPAWDEKPTNAPGGLFRFENPRAENKIALAGRMLEVRMVFPLKPGAYKRGNWKETPRIGAVRVNYVAPVRVLATEDLGR